MNIPKNIQKQLWMIVPGLTAAVLFIATSGLGTTPNRPHFAEGALTITTSDNKQTLIHVEVAETPQQQAYGLMFIKDMPHDHGMIFVNQTDRVEHFWMQNTLIPLDMLFVRADGSIAKIVTNAKPMDTSAISSDELVRDVIELNGGESARIGIKVGDKVAFPGLGNNIE